MLRALVLVLSRLAFSLAFVASVNVRPQLSTSAVGQISMNGGKGFGGGEATRDPAPTAYDPNDPKGKQQAIHKAESFAEYLAKRGTGVATPTAVAKAVRPSATNDVGQHAQA